LLLREEILLLEPGLEVVLGLEKRLVFSG